MTWSCSDIKTIFVAVSLREPAHAWAVVPRPEVVVARLVVPVLPAVAERVEVVVVLHEQVPESVVVVDCHDVAGYVR